VLYPLDFVTHELLLFAAVGFLIGSVDELLIDIIWLARAFWRRVWIYSRNERASASSLTTEFPDPLIAIFVPAWDESAVIGAMLRHATIALGDSNYRLFAGCYPNDAATIAAIQSVKNPKIRAVIGMRPGPTTKADCLNGLWRALQADEADSGNRFAAIVLHDAEDVIHPSEITLFGALAHRFDLIQLPVVPLIDKNSRWIAGHYADEFAEAHGKAMVVREALGAGLPSAGVGTAFSRDMLDLIAGLATDGPFDADSLTEDYELGLKVTALGGRSALVRLPAKRGRAMVAVRAHFPSSLDAAVRQKARWMTGISLQGWDRLGWRGGFAERWMRLRDRRAIVAALILCAAYAALILAVLQSAVAVWTKSTLPPLSARMGWLLSANGAMLVWRMLCRFAFVTQVYGFTEGLRSWPRMVIGNVIAVMAARRAVVQYLLARADGVARWDKTDHVFPVEITAE
jgi:bacteriophage N4 adsorption protein B